MAECGCFSVKSRPNFIGVSRCRLLKVQGLTVTVEGLDAIDKTPVIDIKPYLEEFGPRGAVAQPEWASELTTFTLSAQLPFSRPSYRIAQVTKLDLHALYGLHLGLSGPSPGWTSCSRRSISSPITANWSRTIIAGPRNVSTLSQIDHFHLYTERKSGSVAQDVLRQPLFGMRLVALVRRLPPNLPCLKPRFLSFVARLCAARSFCRLSGGGFFCAGTVCCANSALPARPARKRIGRSDPGPARCAPRLSGARRPGRRISRRTGVDLKQGFGVIDADGADIGLGDIALAADFRQQPFGIGVAFPAHIQQEPGAIGLHAHGAPACGRAFLCVVRLARGACRRDVQACRPHARSCVRSPRGLFRAAHVRPPARLPKYLPARAIARDRVSQRPPRSAAAPCAASSALAMARSSSSAGFGQDRILQQPFGDPACGFLRLRAARSR